MCQPLGASARGPRAQWPRDPCCRRFTPRISHKDCDAAGPGRFNAAISYSPTDEIDPCPRMTKATLLPCVLAGIGSEPVCCGADCLFGTCKDGVWNGKTRISRGTTEGCGSMTSDRNGGVLCCKDPARSK